MAKGKKKKRKMNSNYKGNNPNVKKVEKKVKPEEEKAKKKKLRDRAKEVKKFPKVHKGFRYKPYMKGINIYIDVAKLDNMSKKTTYKVVGEQLMMVDSTMPMNMHLEYQRVLNNHVAEIIYNLKWYQLMLFRITKPFRRKKKLG